MGKAIKRWVEKGLATKLIRRYAGPYTVIELFKNSDLYRFRHSITKEELPPTNVEKLILVPDVKVNDLRESGKKKTSHPSRAQEGEKHYNPGQFLMYLPEKDNQADEGISLKSAQYIEPLGKAPVSEACKQLHSCIFPEAKQILVKRRMRGLTAQCPYLFLQGDPSGGAYDQVLDKVAA